METIPLDQALPLAKLAEHVPALQARAGKHVAPSTLWRWATKGIGGHRLATIKVGAVTCSSVAALNNFLRALNAKPVGPVKLKPADREKQRGRRIAAATKRVKAMGF
jgi:hypothetical protein